jgi:hypothetical protein
MTPAVSEPLRVLLADDHAIVRKGIREFLEEDGEITVVAEAADGYAAVRLARDYRPEVAVLDVQMPGINGIEARARPPPNRTGRQSSQHTTTTPRPGFAGHGRRLHSNADLRASPVGPACGSGGQGARPSICSRRWPKPMTA